MDTWILHPFFGDFGVTDICWETIFTHCCLQYSCSSLNTFTEALVSLTANNAQRILVVLFFVVFLWDWILKFCFCAFFVLKDKWGTLLDICLFYFTYNWVLVATSFPSYTNVSCSQQPVRCVGAVVWCLLMHTQDFTTGTECMDEDIKRILNTPYGFHQHCNTNLSILAAAYLSSKTGICRANESPHIRTVQKPSAHCATDEWRPPVYLNLQ